MNLVNLSLISSLLYLALSILKHISHRPPEDIQEDHRENSRNDNTIDDLSPVLAIEITRSRNSRNNYFLREEQNGIDTIILNLVGELGVISH